MALLPDLAGSWTGTNAFRLMPADPLVARPAQATLVLGAKGHLVSLAYDWDHPDDGAQEGMLVVGSGPDPGSLVAMWCDSWHQQPQPMSFAGHSVNDAVELEGVYAETWGWRIAVSGDASGLHLVMQNVVPPEFANEDHAGGPYDVMVMELGRA